MKSKDNSIKDPGDKTIHEIIELQVERAGDGIAVVDMEDGVSVTYRELNRRANRMARRLREKGVTPDTIVAVMMTRSIDMVVGILGILKAGGAYLPVVPDLPPERIRYMLKESGSKWLLVRGGGELSFKFDGEVIDVTDNSQEHEKKENPGTLNRSSDPVYIIYTSGTTGNPKGVMLEHRSLVNLCSWHNRYFGVTGRDNVAQYASSGFDASVWELFPYMVRGATVHIIPDALKLDVEKLNGYFESRHITIAFLPTQFCEHFMERENRSLRRLLTGGDKLRKFIKRGYTLHNNYGPTENTVVTTSYPVTGPMENIPIGKPVDNTGVYIFDLETRQLQPTGEPGELCISGRGLARGYLNNPELTAEKFVISHLSLVNSQSSVPLMTNDQCPMTIYRTGDLARRLPGGNIEFLGRIDHQVKIRGFRIETGEIETLLLKQPGIKDAVVVARQDNGVEKYLCAYLTGRKTVDISMVRKALAAQLPGYMIPPCFVTLDHLPLTPNGKVDRNALPVPKIEKKQENHTAPRNETEKKLVEIWAGLLNMDKTVIGIDDNFFHLGGHSLKAVVMTTKIHKALNVKISIADIFENGTIRKLTEIVKNAKEEKYLSINSAEKKEYYPQSSAQKRLAILQQLETGSTTYNTQLLDTQYAGIDRARFEEAFRKLITRHEILRTSFTMIDGQAVQKVHEPGAVDFEVEWYESWEGRGRDYDWKKWRKPGDRRKKPGAAERHDVERELPGVPVYEIVEGFVRPFDLSRPPLLRVGLVNVRNLRQIFLLDMHHIVTDGISMVVFMDELNALYEGKSLPPLALQYKDFAQWADGEKEKGELKKQEEFWLNEFRGEIPVLDLPADHPRPATLSFTGDTFYLKIDENHTEQLNQLARAEGVTLYMLLLAAFYVPAARLSGRDDLVVGTVTAGRRHADLQRMMGVFVNTLALRNYPEGGKTFKDFLAEVRGRTLRAFENQDYQFDDLVRRVASRRDPSRNPLFDVSFGLENEFERKGYLTRTAASGKPKPYRFKKDTAMFDLTVIGVETEEGLLFALEYNKNLFKRSTVERLAGYFREVVVSLHRVTGETIMAIEIIPETEKNKILFEFNNTNTGYPGPKTIHALFEEQVEKTEGHVVIGTRSPLVNMTYCELNAQADGLALLLMKKGVKPDTVVAVMAERSIRMIVGILGVLKAGGAYLPIDPLYPLERIDYMLADSRTGILLSGMSESSGLSGWDGDILQIPTVSSRRESRRDTLLKLRRDTPIKSRCSTFLKPRRATIVSNLAYIIYTSGTTGRPKGAAVEHRQAANMLVYRKQEYKLDTGVTSLQLFSFSFDGFVAGFFTPVISGARVILPSEEWVKDIDRLKEIVVTEGVTHFIAVPPLYEVLIESLTKKEAAAVRVVTLAGDRLPPGLLEATVRKNRDLEIAHEYGVTEASVLSTLFRHQEKNKTITIGAPIWNTRIYIPDGKGNPQPIGVPGELCIAGHGLARGYLNKPELTAERFCLRRPGGSFEKPPPGPPQNFLLGTTLTPLYRTGDLARWLPDGSIEFLGRIDRQVKIRGFRIEPGEIENQLVKLPGVKEAIVIDREDTAGIKYLCAYLVTTHPLDTARLREKLAKRLPGYMIPAHFTIIDAVPLTPNGKIDIKALPAPADQAGDNEYEAPRDHGEMLLADIWQQVLGKGKIGIDDDFFSVGGDSIKAIQIVSRLKRDKLTVDVPLLFASKTIRNLAVHLKSTARDRIVDQGVAAGDARLTPIQHWFFNGHEKNRHHFNQSVMLFRRKGFSETLVEKTFNKIVGFHDALRMVYRFDRDTGGILQKNRGIEGKLFELETVRLNYMTKEERTAAITRAANRIQRSIDLETGPLVKLGLFKKTGGDLLLIVIHHLVVDGVSWRIVLEDFEAGYTQAAGKQDIRFPDKTDSFRRWAGKLREYSQSRCHLRELRYWKAIEETPRTTLPTDYIIEKEMRTFRHVKAVSMALTKKETRHLLENVNRTYNTEINDILLTALGTTIRDWAGIHRVSISLEGHGREPLMEDVDVGRTVGWFTTQYPVILDMNGHDTPGTAIKEVKETLRRIPNKGAGYGILKYITPGEKKKSIEFVLGPEITFNYLGQFDGGKPGTLIDKISGVSDPAMGEPIDPDFTGLTPIVVEGAVTGKILRLSFFYNRYEYREITMEKLARMYKKNLRAIMKHCLQKKDKECTPSDLGYNKISGAELEKIRAAVKRNPGENRDIQTIFPLTPLQNDVFFYSLRHPGLCFVWNMVSINGDLDEPLLEKSINLLFRRHDAYRSVFVHELRDSPLRIVLEAKEIKIPRRDISRLGPGEREHVLDIFKREEEKRGFNITEAPPVRITLFKTGASTWKLAWNFHHISMNGYCFGLVFNDLLRIYRDLREGKTPDREPAAPFENYLQWLDKRHREDALGYWKDYLAGYEPRASISKFGKKPGENYTFELETYDLQLDEASTAALMKRAAESGVTLSTLFKVLWGMVLREYTQNDDVVFGTVVSGRPPEIDGSRDIVGLLVNVVPVRIPFKNSGDLPQLLREVQENEIRSNTHDYLPLSEIESMVLPKKRWLDHILAIETAPIENRLKSLCSRAETGFEIEDVENREKTNFDFTVGVVPGACIHISFHFNARVYEAGFVKEVAGQLKKTVRGTFKNCN